MDSTGTTYKLIRETKRISQTSISKKLSISRTALSKIENNKNFTNFPTMIELLEQINMTFEEFLFIANGYREPEKQQIFAKLFSLSNKYSIDLAMPLEQIERDVLFFENSLLIHDAYTLIDAYEMLHQQPSSVKLKHSVDLNAHKIREKLIKMEEWYLIELRIVNSLLFILPTQLSFSLEERICKEMIKYKNFPEMKELSLSIYWNLSTLFFKEGEMGACLKTSNQLKDLSKIAKRYDLYAASLIRIGICTSNMKLIEKGLHILDSIEDYPLRKLMLKEAESRLI